MSAGQKVSVNRASLQPGPQRLVGLVELADAVYEDLQSCYGIYASLFHRWARALPAAPAPSPSSAAAGWGWGRAGV